MNEIIFVSALALMALVSSQEAQESQALRAASKMPPEQCHGTSHSPPTTPPLMGSNSMGNPNMLPPSAPCHCGHAAAPPFAAATAPTSMEVAWLPDDWGRLPDDWTSDNKSTDEVAAPKKGNPRMMLTEMYGMDEDAKPTAVPKTPVMDELAPFDR